MLSPTTPAARSTDFVVRVRAGAAADLTAVSHQPVGPDRRAAAVSALHAASDAAVPGAVASLEQQLHAADPGAHVSVVERLWLDNTFVARVSVDDAAVRAATGHGAVTLLGKLGAQLLDAASLPGGAAATVTGAATTTPGTDPASQWNGTKPGMAVGMSTTPIAQPRAVASPATVGQWFDEPLGISAAHSAGLDGTGVTIAVVDSGVDDTHPQLAGALGRGASIVGGSPLLDPWHGDATVPTRFGSGHGTFVAGLAAGQSTGVAPGAALISSRTYGAGFGDAPGASDAVRFSQRVNAVRALEGALAPGAGSAAGGGLFGDGRAGANLAITSWGMIGQPGSTSTDYDAAMKSMADAGVVVMAAAGNDGGDPSSGTPTISNPASLPDVFAVAGLGRDLHRHGQSSVGPDPRHSGSVKPDFATPAADLRSLAPGGGEVDTSGNPDYGFGGTSASAPIAAGMVALFDQHLARNKMTPVDTHELLQLLPLLTVDLNPDGIDAGTGHGGLCLKRIDEATAALAKLRA